MSTPALARSVPARSIFPIPGRLSTTLYYADSFTVGTGALGAYFEQLMRLNSLFDPDLSFTGHQPRGFDQMAAFYNRYVVWGVDVEIDCLGLTALAPGFVVVFASNDTTSASSTASAAELPYSQRVIGSTSFPGKIQLSIPLYELNQVSKQVYLTDDRYQSLTSTNPSELLILHLGVDSPNGTANNNLVGVKLSFRCEFFDPIQVGSS